MTDTGHRLHKPGVAGSSPAAAIVHEASEIYFARPDTSASNLKALDESPRAYYRTVVQKTAPAKESPAFRYGHLLHQWHELTAEVFWPRAKKCPAEHSTAAGGFTKSADGWIADLPADAIPICAADYEKLEQQTEQILENPAAVELIEGSTPERREFVILFDWDGEPCRGRMDGATDPLLPDGCLYDLKTTSDKNPALTFHRSCKEFKYDLQAAFYQHASVLAGWPPNRLRFIATSTVFPFHCEVMTLPDIAIKQATARISELIAELRMRRSLDWWAPRTSGKVIEMPARYFQTGRGW